MIYIHTHTITIFQQLKYNKSVYIYILLWRNTCLNLFLIFYIPGVLSIGRKQHHQLSLCKEISRRYVHLPTLFYPHTSDQLHTYRAHQCTQHYIYNYILLCIVKGKKSHELYNPNRISNL